MCFAPWGGRRTQQSFIQGGSAPRCNLLLFKRGSPWALELKKKSRLVTTAATSRQRFWSKILLVHKVPRDFFAIHKPHRSIYIYFFACLLVLRFFSFCLFVCLFDFVLNCLFQEPRKRRFTNWSSVIGTFRIPRRPWDEHNCEANAGQLLCKNKTNRGICAESLENDRNIKNSKISKLKLYQ